jgi:sensor histidine kinase regulating citrate/malate metabolism
LNSKAFRLRGFHEEQAQHQKSAFHCIVLNAVQILSVAGVLLYGALFRTAVFGADSGNGYLLMIVLSLTALLNGLLSLRYYMMNAREVLQDTHLKETIEQIGSLNKTLRGQRHDFMNHLQVVYSLMEMEEYVEARSYIEKTYTDIQKVSRVLKTESPAVNALLQAKLLSCEKRGISAAIRVTSLLHRLPIPEWELCKVLGNLLDNAIYALSETKENRRLAVEIYEDLKTVYFRISDNGPPVPPEYREKIYEAGFTTKGEHGEGMGLAIVKETAAEYGGTITLESDQAETAFTVAIPKLCDEA